MSSKKFEYPGVTIFCRAKIDQISVLKIRPFEVPI